MPKGDVKIERVEIADCRLPLETPVHLGSVRVKTRDYVCIRIVTNIGIDGFAIGYRSGSQLFENLKALAPRLAGQDPLMRQEILLALEKSFVPSRASYVRAVSLIDVALWDIAAKAADMPLYKLLGGIRTEIQAVPIVGFNSHMRPLDEIQREIARHGDQSENLVKVMISGSDAVGDSAYIQSLTAAFEGTVTIGVDAHWSWRTITEALNTCRRLDDLGLAFIEDPFLPQQWRLAGELRDRIKTPVAVGEDVLDLYGFLDVAENADIVRVDATGSGGISSAMNAMSVAAALGRQTFPHVFPYLHVQLACAHGSAMAIEYIPEHTGTDPVRSILLDFPPVRNGKMAPSEEPGAGCRLDWAKVSETATNTAAVT